jgi:tetratricopeptide (TPR) repeat protein
MSKKATTIDFTFPAKTAYLIISAVSVILYINTLNHGFALDDIAVIENNKLVKEGIKSIPELFTTFYWKGFWDSNAGLYRPLSLVMFAIEYQLSPNNPLIHHLFNILLYTVACCLLYKFLVKFFRTINPLFFLFVTLLFVVNPLHTEVVANIKSRDEILALLFFLLCCDQLYIKVANNKTYALLMSAAYFFLALLSKEGAIIFLPIIFLLDYLKEKNILTILKNRSNLIIASVIWLALHQYVIRSSGPVITYTPNDNSLVAGTFLEQKATALGMFARYMAKLIYPYELSYDYSFNQIPIINFSSPLALLGLAFLGVLIYFAFSLFKKNPLVSISIAFILLPLFLTGNLLFNIGATMADRFLFVSTIGSSILIALLFFKLLKTDIVKNFSINKVAILFIPVLLILSVKTFSRNSDWKDNATLFAKDVTTVPNSARVHYNYGTSLMANSYGTNTEQASIPEFERCLQIDPTYYDALINLGSVYVKKKEYKSAIATYKKGLQLKNNHGMLCGNIGDAYFRSQEPDSAIVYLERAHTLGNRIPASYEILGSIWFNKKEYAKACKTFEEGLKAGNSTAGLYMNYGNALAMSNRDQEAIKAFETSYKMNPSNIQPLYFLAITYDKLGDKANSGKYYSEYQRLKK